MMGISSTLGDCASAPPAAATVAAATALVTKARRLKTSPAFSPLPIRAGFASFMSFLQVSIIAVRWFHSILSRVRNGMMVRQQFSIGAHQQPASDSGHPSMVSQSLNDYDCRRRLLVESSGGKSGLHAQSPWSRD
jgi:hypothetical protein